MDSYILSVTLEVGIWALYSGIAYLTAEYCLRRYERRRPKRYAAVSTSSSGGDVELDILSRDGGGGSGSGAQHVPVNSARRPPCCKSFLAACISLNFCCSDGDETVPMRRGVGGGRRGHRARESQRQLLSSLASKRDSTAEENSIGDVKENGIHHDAVVRSRESANNLALLDLTSSPSTAPTTSPLTPGFTFRLPPTLASVSRRDSRFRRRASRCGRRCAVFLLFIFVGYLMTALSAIIVYRASEHFVLYSDAVRCPNVTFDPASQDFDPSKVAVEDRENCAYFFAPNSSTSFEDVFVDVSGTAVHAWWIRADPSGPYYRPPGRDGPRALLYTHGNADNLSFFKKLYSFVSVLGLDVLAWDYPGFGRSGGRPSERLIDAAADEMMAWLINSRGFDPAHVVLWGYSLGGAVTAELASRWPDVRGVVMQAPIDSAAQVVRSFLPLTGWTLSAVMTQRYDTNRLFPSLRSCLFQFVGDRDEMFSLPRSWALFHRATEANQKCKKFVEVKGLGHLEDPLDHADFRREVRAYFDKIFSLTEGGSVHETSTSLP